MKAEDKNSDLAVSRRLRIRMAIDSQKFLLKIWIVSDLFVDGSRLLFEIRVERASDDAVMRLPCLMKPDEMFAVKRQNRPAFG